MSSSRRPSRRVGPRRDHEKEDYLTLDQLATELEKYSVAISGQIRTIYLGILGLSWLMLLGDEKVEKLAAKLPHPALLAISVVCLVALVLDLCQYLFGERAVNEAFDAAAESEKRAAPYNSASFSYRAAFYCYRFKLGLTLLGASALIVVVARAI